MAGNCTSIVTEELLSVGFESAVDVAVAPIVACPAVAVCTSNATRVRSVREVVEVAVDLRVPVQPEPRS